MNAARKTLLALAAVAAIGGCTQEQVDQRHLTVTGPRDDVERFIAVEAARAPALPALDVSSLPDGRAQARLGIPATYGSDDLVRMTKQAVDAGLSYQLEIGG